MRILIFVLAILVFPVNLNGQEKEPCYAGVFVSQEDFLKNRLSHRIDTKADGNKLSFAFPADATLTLKLTAPHMSLTFPPGSIYGYENCGKVYRYFEGGRELNAQEDYYKIEQAGGLIIYSSGFVSGNEIFYSTDLTTPIHRLTLANLKKDFGNYPEFIEEAKKLKGKADGLVTTDDDGFVILRLYEQRGAMTKH